MTVLVRRAAATDGDLAAIAAIINESSPEDGCSVASLRWSDATYPGGRRFIAELDGQPVGAATVGRIYIYPPEFDAFWATVDVVPDARRRGAGRALLGATVASALDAGKSHLHLPTAADRPEAIAFLERRGFAEFERAAVVRLDLAGLAAPVVEPPDGIELTDLASRPELVPGVHAVACEAFADIPGEEPVVAGELAEFRARDVDRPGIPPGGFAIAIERSTGRVVGYASLLMKPGSSTIAFHDMTAVARAWRGRGLATALKSATISWAVANGLEALETGNDEENRSMRAVNDRLGYRRLADLITMRGALDRAMMAR